ncbi:hypothetical protein [Larkinella sp.]|uniref:hypothetical protein n=1 Tax=Larkinella sp. TaxID=2034517 RepID=UPI003BABB6E5
MKRLLTFFGLFIAFTSLAQEDEEGRFPVDPDTKLVTYSKVVTIEGANKEQLTGRVKYFFTHAFRERSLRHIESDALSGFVSTKGAIWLDTGLLAPYAEILIPVAVWIKDGRYRYDISHIYILEINSADDKPLEDWVKRSTSNRVKNRVDTILRQFIADLETCMNNSKLDNF